MVQFPQKKKKKKKKKKNMINGAILILTLSIFRSLTATSLGVPRMECIHLNLFDSLEHLLTLLSLIIVIKP